MIKYNLNNFIKGWFCGNFQPSIINTKDFEVAVKHYKKGESEERHYHKKAFEITIIINGKVKMNDEIYKTNDIIFIDKFEDTNFKALKNTSTCVIKIPSVNGDKYLGVAKDEDLL